MKSAKILMMAVLSILSVSLVAQDSTKHKMKIHKVKSEKITYTCPMHPEVSGKKPGKCSKCGMDLKEKTAIAYACPMKCEGDKTYNKPGKCPVCGMNLKEKVKKEMIYSCPMHPEVTSDKPGKCSKCGMDLKEKPAIAYACPMKCEGDKTYDKPGKCPVCGMNLKEKKDDHSDHKHQ